MQSSINECLTLQGLWDINGWSLKAFGYDFDQGDYHSFVHGRLTYEYLKPNPVLRSLLQYIACP
ncbi:hypothetical protein HanXRQr2_Chr10g0420131 [Helianthus annuus]|uniref:Uncharacterized protein n=1 Tax=Helianthus annuus TaxID=4232 RepID=A0A9K3HUC2_HELAN|nr:hypothetical protein HanXRQr2_Chr10g0420131 [Helianthus annuus]KAJ0528500.1 hypothetical protein HanHA89_Chr10g0367091 [Helianthus annuus]